MQAYHSNSLWVTRRKGSFRELLVPTCTVRTSFRLRHTTASMRSEWTSLVPYGVSRYVCTVRTNMIVKVHETATSAWQNEWFKLWLRRFRDTSKPAINFHGTKELCWRSCRLTTRRNIQGPKALSYVHSVVCMHSAGKASFPTSACAMVNMHPAKSQWQMRKKFSSTWRRRDVFTLQANLVGASFEKAILFLSVTFLGDFGRVTWPAIKTKYLS